MVVNLLAAYTGFLFQSTTGCDVNFASNDGFDTGFSCRLVELDCPIHDTVICHCHGRKFQFGRMLHEPVDPAGCIQQ